MRGIVKTQCVVFLFLVRVAAAAEVPAPSRLVALVGKRPVTVRDLADWLRLGNTVPAKAARKDWQEALQAMVNRAVLLEAARREQLTVSDLAVTRAIRARMRGPRAADYEREIRLLGLTAEQARRRMREQLLLQQLLSAKLGVKFFVSPKAAVEWYEKNKDLLASPEVRVVRVITLRVQGKRTDAAGKARIEGVRERAAGGADFEKLANEHSEDPWAAKGGLLDPMRKGESGSIFADEVFAMGRPGEMSPAFKTKVGYHLLRLEAVKPPVVPRFEDVRATIRERLLEELRARHLPELAAKLRRATTVRVFWKHMPWPENNNHSKTSAK